MTITEANDVNVLLRDYIATVQNHRKDTPPEERVVQSAVYLADRASKALGAGLTGAQVREALS